eukprot:m.36608 g.36608  ORF g.36608 m.36608 type:complete len:362 (+) comp9156_c0_seq2:101-1186(+)
MTSVHLWLREETKQHERRTALTPVACSELISKGFTVTVEKMKDRCFADDEYEKSGCTMVEGGSWTTAPSDAYIVGLKELPEDGSPLKHRHIYFGHCYKDQGGWKELLGRFSAGGGTLLDLEFLTHDNGRRVAAFGFMAGFCGAAVGLMAYDARSKGEELSPVTFRPHEEVLIDEIKDMLKKIQKPPRVLVMGAMGRCGTGAVSLLEKAGLSSEQIVKWDMAETKKGGPFPELLEFDIFVNCIYLMKKIPPFLTNELLEQESRELSVIVDVSCDTTNPNNPLPMCNVATTFDKPIHRLALKDEKNLDIVAIDHLPTLLPRESSEHFCRDLMPSILQIPNLESDASWKRLTDLFQEKLDASQK